MAVSTTTYKWLAPRPGSRYRQWFVQGGSLPAEVLYRATIGPEPRTPEEVAQDYGIPREAVDEAIDYCLRHADLLQQEREAVMADIRRRGLDQRPAVPTDGVA